MSLQEVREACCRPLLDVFDKHLECATLTLQEAQHESLYGLTLQCVTAFKSARDDTEKGIPPLVTGNDPFAGKNPYALEQSEKSLFAVAVANVYGFGAIPTMRRQNPKSLETLDALRKIADHLHANGLNLSA